MDFKKLASEVIPDVQRATRKEDEEWGGQVLAEKLQEALTSAGYDLEAKPDLYGAWYGVPDDVLMNLTIAFLEDPKMHDENDPAITRIKSDFYMALEENPHLEEEYPDFWKRSHELL